MSGAASEPEASTAVFVAEVEGASAVPDISSGAFVACPTSPLLSTACAQLTIGTSFVQRAFRSPNQDCHQQAACSGK